MIAMSVAAARTNYGMEGDEVFSYLSATSMGGFKEICFLDDQTWYEGSYFANALTATGEECFNLKMVFENQAMDTHPPLFYVCLNFVCSLFAGQFSVWYGIGINIVFMLLVGVGLYLLLNYFLKNKYMSLVLSTIFCCSELMIDMVLFVRMYVLLMALFLFQSWYHLKLYDRVLAEDGGLPIKKNKKNYVILLIITLLGALTHYYFLIYQCLIAFIFVIGLWLKNRKKDVFRYVGTMAVSGILYICSYPAMLNHMFFKYRGREAVHKFLKESSLFGEVLSMLDSFDNELFKGSLFVIVIVLLIVTVLLLVQKKIKWNAIIKGAVLLFPCCVYFFGVSKASPFVTIRYVSPVAALIFALLCIWGKYSIDHIGLNTTWIKECYVILCIILFFTTFYFFREPIKEESFAEKRDVVTELAEKADYCIYITADEYNWKMWEDYVLYPQFEGLFFIDGRWMEPITDEKLKEQDNLVVFVDRALDGEEVRGYLAQYLDIKEYNVEYSSSYVDVIMVQCN